MRTTATEGAYPSGLAEAEPGLPNLVLLAALEDNQSGIIIFDAQFRIFHLSNQVRTLLNVEADSKLLESPEVFELLSSSKLIGSSVEAAKEYIAEFPEEKHDRPLRLERKNGECALQMRVRSLGHGYSAAFFELDEPHTTKPALVEGSGMRDSLTGLATRRSFEQALETAMAGEGGLGVAAMLLDLDRFKAVNDTLGHAAGDTLLSRVAERLQVAVRSGDLVARFGGDEFGILMSGLSGREQPAGVAARILDLVQRTYLIDGQLANVGVSIGIAFAPEDGTDPKSLLLSADLALYQSKETGKARFSFFDQSMTKRAQARRTSELDLRRALALRQLEIYYQPQVTTNGLLVGFEALIRWNHPERGMIPPNDFIPLAERIGVIVPMGEWVLRTACKQAVAWPEDVVIAVNASPLQIENGGFTDAVRRALKLTGLPGHRLEIEITEGTLLGNGDVVMQTLTDLRAMNVRIAMDDFGTGYASLSQLARFPFDKIKIDRSLAGFEGDDAKKRAIVRAITALGQSLGVCTLAEGVEDEQQLARLHLDGCTSVQGYHFGKPIPASELPDVFSRLSGTEIPPDQILV